MGKTEEFQEYAKEGNLKAMKLLLNDLNDKERQQMIHDSCSLACTEAVYNGHINVLNFLLEKTPKEKHHKMIHTTDLSVTSAFIYAASNGHIKVLKFLLKVTPEEKHQEIIHFNEDSAFHLALEFGHINVLNFLLELTPKKHQPQMIYPDDNSILDAVVYGHINALKFLCIAVPSYKEWFAKMDDYIKHPIKPYSSINLKELENIALTSKNILNSTKIIFKDFSKTKKLSNKKKKLTDKNIFKSIFTPNNEIILKIMEFLSGGTIKQIKSAIPAIQKAGGINIEFIKEYDSSFTEEKEVKISGGVDSSLEQN